ncbi:MAG: hypothetical protein LBQ90_12090, partial [Synergistaceae bacterium]|nr:hypothetical protein [Synergistaceae bacterium]
MCIEKGGENRWGGFFHGPGYGLRLSAVLYDASADALVVLREATATQNFPAGRQAAAVKKKTFAGELRQTGKS